MAKATLTKKTSKTPLDAEKVGLKYGFRSGLEERAADQLTAVGMGFTFESLVVPYTRPAKVHKYTPDFALANGIIVETKGRFLTEDRQKQLLVKAQHPELDVRFVFSNSKTKINKRSTTTYADWCSKNGLQYADKLVPHAWLNEPVNEASLSIIKGLSKEK